MIVRFLFFTFLANAAINKTQAQPDSCTFKPPFYTMHFGKGNVTDVNLNVPAQYDRVPSSCPGDGYYSYTSSTNDCFGGDWHTLTEDHTPGDADGNMLLVNSAFEEGVFLSTKVQGFKGERVYQFAVWLMNVCRPTRKCPFPLLPRLIIRLQTPAGETVAQFSTGELPREEAPRWVQHKAYFTVPPSVTELSLTILNNAPGGCGNDFAMDDLSFRECVKPDPANVVEGNKIRLIAAALKRQAPVTNKLVRKAEPTQAPAKRRNPVTIITQGKRELPANNNVLQSLQPVASIPVPLVLKQRKNSLTEEIKTFEGEVLIDLYDNGEIDGDTVSIYHNNVLIASQQQLSQKPISLRIRVDKKQPHHELVMVANNLGSIPPNTSLMIVTTKEKRYQVSISSTQQQNAKVVIDLKE